MACESSGPTDSCSEPSYGGRATDEAWHALVDTYDYARMGHGDASEIWTPREAETLTRTRAPRVTWTRPMAALTCQQGWCGSTVASTNHGWSFIPGARAHLPPISGDIYLVEFVAEGLACAVSTVTTDDQWLPSAQEWARLAEVEQVELRITSAFLEDNRVVEGPFRTTRTFRFDP